MENQINLDQLYSENLQEYENEISKLRDYVKYEGLTQEDQVIIQQKIIPLIIFFINNKNNNIREQITFNELEIIYFLIMDHQLETVLIQNNIIQALFNLARRFKKTFDSKIIQILAILKDTDESEDNISNLIRYLFGVSKVMFMTGFQSNKAYKIRLVYRICDIKRENKYQIIEPFVNSLFETLSQEGNQTEQFIVSVEILSQLIRFQKIKEYFLNANILKKIIESISRLTKNYRSVLHNILKICIELIKLNKASQIFVLHCGLLKYIPSLIESNNFDVQEQLQDILFELCKDELIINRLFLNQIVSILIDKYDQNPKQARYFRVFKNIFLNAGDSLIKYKTILNKFMEAFFKGIILNLSNLMILHQKFEFIYQLKQQDLYQKEINQFFELNEQRINLVFNQLRYHDQELVELLLISFPRFQNP